MPYSALWEGVALPPRSLTAVPVKQRPKVMAAAVPARKARKSMAERTPSRHAYKRGQLRHRPLFGLAGWTYLSQSALEGRFTQPSNFTFRLPGGKTWLIEAAAAIYALRRRGLRHHRRAMARRGGYGRAAVDSGVK